FADQANGTCGRCHTFDKRNGEWVVKMQKLPLPQDANSPQSAAKVEMVPSRWMRHATFSHNSHRAVQCTECHSDATKSVEVSDILMPSIELCQKCHGANEPSSSHVSADCVLCHTYHNQPLGGDSHSQPIDKLLSNGSSTAADDAKP